MTEMCEIAHTDSELGGSAQERSRVWGEKWGAGGVCVSVCGAGGGGGGAKSAWGGGGGLKVHDTRLTFICLLSDLFPSSCSSCFCSCSSSS